ncbi:hypothetical protein FOA43_004591 [Brettanomyces nanus]|uniref:Uncharacterized protein n=1 Tax=Eeniella nana TaxID=13502 RepID=A0A875SEY1_EENNA|nr:uncharacterized protein FOA43_004591 [Brettanomyces nanus]QPG77184.1 hypothetical protein FOA43_004591 [Brettanomyces nanus]
MKFASKLSFLLASLLLVTPALADVNNNAHTQGSADDDLKNGIDISQLEKLGTSTAVQTIPGYLNGSSSDTSSLNSFFSSISKSLYSDSTSMTSESGETSSVGSKTDTTEYASTDSPDASSTENASTDLSEAASTENVSTDSSDVASTENVSTDSSDAASTENVSTDSSDAASIENVSTDSPEASSTENVSTDSPEASSTENVSTDSPEASSTENVSTDSPDASSTDASTESIDSQTYSSENAATTVASPSSVASDAITTSFLSASSTNTPDNAATTVVSGFSQSSEVQSSVTVSDNSQSGNAATTTSGVSTITTPTTPETIDASSVPSSSTPYYPVSSSDSELSSESPISLGLDTSSLSTDISSPITSAATSALSISSEISSATPSAETSILIPTASSVSETAISSGVTPVSSSVTPGSSSVTLGYSSEPTSTGNAVSTASYSPQVSQTKPTRTASTASGMNTDTIQSDSKPSTTITSSTTGWLPDVIVTQSGSAALSLTSSMATTALPKAIAPAATSAAVPEDDTLITIGFKQSLNYVFVVEHSISSAQIFEYLPNVLANSFVNSTDIIVKQLVPYTSSQLDYIITVAEVYYKKDYIDALQTAITDLSSEFYQNPSSTQDTLAGLIDSKIPIDSLLEGSTSLWIDEDSGSSDGSIDSNVTPQSLGSMDFSSQANSSVAKMKVSGGRVAGIVAGSSVGVATCLGVVVALFRRHRKNRKSNDPFADDYAYGPDSSISESYPKEDGASYYTYSSSTSEGPIRLGDSSAQHEMQQKYMPRISNPMNVKSSLGW